MRVTFFIKTILNRKHLEYEITVSRTYCEGRDSKNVNKEIPASSEKRRCPAAHKEAPIALFSRH